MKPARSPCGDSRSLSCTTSWASAARRRMVSQVEPARARRYGPRPLWVGFGATEVLAVLTELIRLGLINGGFE